MKVIGHRGAAGLALENTETAIRKALELKVPIIEIDVRLTYDKKLVVCHDADLKKIAGDNRKIDKHNWAELENLVLKDGSKLLLLEDALRLVGKTQVLIELKDGQSEYALLAALDAVPGARVVVISFNWGALALLKELRPTLRIYLSERTNGIESVQFARRLKFDGVMLNVWVLSPIAYWLARRAKQTVCVYTVNSRFIAWFIKLFYPQIQICTDFPDRLLPRRRRR